ncbi:MAG: TonB-dependent receptor [Balneolales bacterium]|nr:TonB-dependent receptor [Balneolales bacterium]
MVPTSGVAQENEQRQGSITGQVVDAQTLEPLFGVNLIIEKTLQGDATDLEGNFAIEPLTPGIYSVTVRYIGYETKTIPDIIVGANRAQILEVKLNPSTVIGDEITVSAGYFSDSKTEGIGKVSFSNEEIRRSPGAAQELGRVLNALPSVASRGETSQDLLVRGGSPSENGNYIDNIPLPNIRHFQLQSGQSGGPIGIVNTELISDIEFSAGAFSSKFGEHLSSVSNISYRDGNNTRLRGDAGLNLAGFVVNLDGPINENLTYLVSARRSYLDLIADAINAGGAPSFQDVQAKVTFSPNTRNEITFLNIYGGSLFENDVDEAFDEGFEDAVSNENIQNTAGLNWRHLWGNGYSNTSISYSFRDQDQLLTNVLTNATSVDYESMEAMAVLRNVNYLRLNSKNSIEFGLELRAEQNDYDYFIAAQTNRSGEVQPDIFVNNEVNGSISSAFGAYTVQLTPRLSSTIGLRGNYNSYNEDFNIAPRAKARYQVNSRFGINASYGIQYQAAPRYLISQNEVLADLKSTRSDHYILGLDYLLTDDTQLTIEVYNKEYRNAPILPEINTIGDPSYILDAFDQFYDVLEDDGEAYARGVEFLIQKKLAVDFYGMVSASYYRTRYKDFNGDWQDRIFDNQYLFSVIGGYRPNDLWELSVRWSILGGRSYTPIDPVASAAAGTEILDLTRFNEETYPAYHSLFARVDRRFFLKRTNMVVFLEVWNAYNQQNVETDFWNIQTQEIDRATQFNLLPVSGFKFEF